MQFCAKAEHTQLSTSQPAAHTDLQIYTHIQEILNTSSLFWRYVYIWLILKIVGRYMGCVKNLVGRHI